MSLFALPVTVDDMLDLQDCIQFFTNQAQATSQAAAINAGTTTVYDYALQLLAANLATSQVAVAVPSLILNETPTVGVIENVTLNFLPDQIDFAVAQGLDPVVYAAEAWAVNVASSNAADFNALYGNLNSTQFAAVVSTTTGVNTDAILNFIANWQAFFSANPNAIPPNLDVTTASYAAAFGDAIGNALVDDSVFTEGVNEFAENALLTICTGQYVAGVAPGAIPQHTPLQGEQNLRLTIGVDILSTSAPDQVFDATPAANPPFGSDNTLNTGDTLTDTAGDGTINFTTAGGLGQFVSNPPFALGVNMDGIQTANILHSFPLLVPAGFSGNIEGLTNVNLVAGNIGDVQLGLPTLGLLSAVENITIDSVGPIISLLPDLELWMDDSAFDGTQVLDLTLNGVGTLGLGFEAEVDLEVVGGSTGYGQVNVFSNTGPNALFLDSDSMDSIATVTATGSQDLTISGDVLTQGLLELFNGSAMTGDLVVGFPAGVGGIEAIGGQGNDDFWFFSFSDDPTTFTADDSVDGGPGDNRLFLEAYNGALLGTGVGPNIVNIDTIVHTNYQLFGDFFKTMTGDLTVDMSRSGSANELELAAYYANTFVAPGPGDLFNVDVTNLLNADVVVYTGDLIDNLTLEHVGGPNVLGNINFTMAQDVDIDGNGVSYIADLITTQPGVILNLESTGSADINVIEDADSFFSDGIFSNIKITGDTDLSIGLDTIFGGNISTPYDFGGGGLFSSGIVDASEFTGDLRIATGFFNQIVTAGSGDDFIDIQASLIAVDSDLIDLSVGGSDTVQFEAVYFNPFGSLFFGDFNYHFVEGFDVADDVIAVNVAGVFDALETTIGTDVPVGADPLFFEYTGGVAVPAFTFPFNFLKIEDPVNAGIVSAQTGFDIGIGLFESILVAGAPTALLGSYYDATGEQAVIFALTGPALADNVITAFDPIVVVGLVGMSEADYAAFGPDNIAFNPDPQQVFV